MNNKLLSLLGLMRRAGKLSLGFDAAAESAVSGESSLILTADLFYENAAAARDAVSFPVRIIVTRMQDELPPHLALAYSMTKGRPFLKFPESKRSAVSCFNTISESA